MVLHYTAMNSAKAALERLCDPVAEVSSHYLIGRDGTLWQLVNEADRAWHAGPGSWHGCDDINSRSIGIELDNPGTCPFSEPLMAQLEALLTQLVARHAIQDVIGHSDMAPGRKIDPGPRFDWRRLERQGLAARRAMASGAFDGTVAQFRAIAKSVGYTADVDDDTLLHAVRLRYRPGASGPIGPDDVTPLAKGAHWT